MRIKNQELRIKGPACRQVGFTLVELLIVVSIIGVLATILMANFIGVRQRARDAQRKSDLRQLQAALELWRADTGSYSINTTTYRLNTTTCALGSQSFSNSGTVYMQKIPCDPLGTSVYNSGNYYYYSDGTTYTLAACIENTSDGDATSTAPTPFSGTTCTSGTYFVVTNP